MLLDIKREFALVGLKLNSDKCKVQCSVEVPRSTKSIIIEGDEFPIVSSSDGFGLLGTTYTLTGGTKEEVKNRIRLAWGKFHQIWPLLRHRGASLNQRLRVFNAVMGRSFLWGAESWTLTVAEKLKVRGVERSMLRRFAGPRRATGEDWVSWVRRATKKATEAAERAGLKSWVFQHACAKWRWAGHVARMEEYRPESWAVKTTFWRSSAWRAENGPGSELYSLRPLRSRAGRWLRWEDEVQRYRRSSGLGDWRREARNKTDWSGMAEEFAKIVAK